MKKKARKKVLKQSLWAAIAKLISVGLGAGAGSLLHTLLGDGFNGWTGAAMLAVASFVLMWYSEYEAKK